MGSLLRGRVGWQARAFGVGQLLATQNPVDVDYKGLSNAGTWFIGKLQAERKAVKGKDITFVISPYEQKTANDWMKEHKKTCRFYVDSDGNKIKNSGGAIGGLSTYKFTPTGIGVAIIAECACGEETNITDYDMW